MHPLLSASFTLALILYSWSRKSLTPLGIVAATFTAAAHAIHPWSAFYGLLVVFFLSGTFVTKVKHARKTTLTTSSAGGAPSPSIPTSRTATQVFANSLPATVLILVHVAYLRARLTSAPASVVSNHDRYALNPRSVPQVCLPYPSPRHMNNVQSSGAFQSWVNAAPYGIVAAYATAAADTFASELGILATSAPVLLTDLLRLRVTRVPRGTNGGITRDGVLASALGAALIGAFAVIALPLCGAGAGAAGEDRARAAWLRGPSVQRDVTWSGAAQLSFVAVVTVWGVLGGLLDSLLGAWCQASVVDGRSGKIVEGEGGRRVVFRTSRDPSKIKSGDKASGQEGRKLVVGRDLLSNNGVNLVTGVAMSSGAMALVVWWTSRS